MSAQSATPATLEPSNRQLPPGGVDPNVKIPPAVKRAAARSEEILKQSKGEQPSDPPATPSDAPPASPPAEPTPAAPPAETPPATPPATPPVTTPPAPSNENRDPVPWDQYNAMKGRFDKANRDVARMSDEITNLRNLIATMSVAPPAATPPASDPAQSPASLITPKDIEDYGPEFIDLIGRKAKEIADQQTSELRKQVEQLSRGVTATQQVTAATAREQLIASMDDKVPNWREVNSDPNFLAWLRLPDPFSGAIRQELLKAAFDQNQTARVMAFFNGFLTEEAAVAPAGDPPPNPAPQPKVTLESLAAPGRAKSAPATPPAEKPFITTAQIAKFYADVGQGKYRGRDEEKNRLEATIFEAQREGRIR